MSVLKAEYLGPWPALEACKWGVAERPKSGTAPRQCRWRGASLSGTRGHVLARFARCLRHPQSKFHANSFTAPKAAGIHAAARVTRYKGTQLRAPAVLQRTRLF